LSFFDKLKKAFVNKPVSGVAIISDVEEVQKLLEEIVDEVMAENEQNKQ